MRRIPFGAIFFFILVLPFLVLFPRAQAFENASVDAALQVGIYACRPTPLGNAGEDKEELVVHFTDFELVHT